MFCTKESLNSHSEVGAPSHALPASLMDAAQAEVLDADAVSINVPPDMLIDVMQVALAIRLELEPMRRVLFPAPEGKMASRWSTFVDEMAERAIIWVGRFCDGETSRPLHLDSRKIRRMLSVGLVITFDSEVGDAIDSAGQQHESTDSPETRSAGHANATETTDALVDAAAPPPATARGYPGAASDRRRNSVASTSSSGRRSSVERGDIGRGNAPVSSQLVTPPATTPVTSGTVHTSKAIVSGGIAANPLAMLASMRLRRDSKPGGLPAGDSST